MNRTPKFESFILSNLIIDFVRKNYRIVVAGPGGCGKNYAKDLLENIGFVYGPSYTSRPMREGEINGVDPDKDIRDGETAGVDYNFIRKDQFEEMIANNEFYEYVEFGGKYYGTTKKQFHEDCNLFIMTADGVEEIKDEDRKNTIVIYFDIDDEILRKRLTARGDSEEAVEMRRLNDEALFGPWEDFDIIIENELFTEEELVDHIMELLIISEIELDEAEIS